jgi:hypothetical protein
MTRWTRAAAGAMLVLAAAASPASVGRAQDGAADAKKSVVKTKDGLHFNVPPDWPIEERNGVVGPIPVEEYMARKFAGMESRLKTLEQQVAGYDLRLRVLEEATQGQRQQQGGGGGGGGGLRSSGQGAR